MTEFVELEERLRAALDSRADGVAVPKDAWTRISNASRAARNGEATRHDVDGDEVWMIDDPVAVESEEDEMNQRGWILIGAVAAALIVVVGLVFMLADRDEEVDLTGLPPTSVVLPGPGADPVALVETFWQAATEADYDTTRATLSDSFNTLGAVTPEMYMRTVLARRLGLLHEVSAWECFAVPDERADLEDPPPALADTSVVVCDIEQIHPHFAPLGVDEPPGVVRFEISTDGIERFLEYTDYGFDFTASPEARLVAWLEQNDFDSYSALRRSTTSIEEGRAQGELTAQKFQEWADYLSENGCVWDQPCP